MYNNFRSSVFNITAVNIWTMYVWTMVVCRIVSGLYHQQKPCTVQIWITSQISRNVNFIKIVLEPWKTTDLCTFQTSILDGWFSVTPSCKLLENWRPARRATDAEKPLALFCNELFWPCGEQIVTPTISTVSLISCKCKSIQHVNHRQSRWHQCYKSEWGVVENQLFLPFWDWNWHGSSKMIYAFWFSFSSNKAFFGTWIYRFFKIALVGLSPHLIGGALLGTAVSLLQSHPWRCCHLENRSDWQMQILKLVSAMHLYMFTLFEEK